MHKYLFLLSLLLLTACGTRHAPVIGISCSRSASGATQLATTYTEAVQRAGGVAGREHIGQQVAGLKGRGVAPVGGFIVGRAVDVIEDGARQPLAGHAAKVVEVLALMQTHGWTFIDTTRTDSLSPRMEREEL